MLGKKSLEKSAEKFLNSHEYREKNGWGKKRESNFPGTHE